MEMIKSITNSCTNRILYLLVITDLLFIGLHIVDRKTDVISNPLFLLSVDQSYSEVFQYIKMFWIIILIGSAAIRVRASLYFIWALIFSYLLLDDFIRLHETIGGQIIGDKLTIFFPNLGNASYPFGQIVYAILLGGLFLTAGIIFYNLNNQFVKKTSNYLLILLCTFAFFSVVVDAVGAFVELLGIHTSGIPIIEDGGELIVMSIIAWLIFSVHLHVYKYGANFMPNIKKELQPNT